jgi:hypothetical protein
MTKDARVDEYINTLPDWQQAICNQVRQYIHQAEPDIVETIKFTNRPYFMFDGNVCALLATKDHVNVFIYDPIAPDPTGLINQGQDNATARSIQIYKDQSINQEAFINLIRAVVANNRAGGWRKLKKAR